MTIDLQTLADRIEIEERLFLYGHLLDTGRLEQVADAVFTEDADIHLGGERLVGRTAITARLEEYRPVLKGTSHVITNVVIAVNGDEASAYAKVCAWHWFARPDADPLGPTDLMSVGGYEDKLRRTERGWRIHHRRGYSSGSGIGIGLVPELLRPVFEAMWGRTPDWPAGSAT